MTIKKNLALFVVLNAILVGNNLQAMQKAKQIIGGLATLGGSFVFSGTCTVITEKMKQRHYKDEQRIFDIKDKVEKIRNQQ